MVRWLFVVCALAVFSAPAFAENETPAGSTWRCNRNDYTGNRIALVVGTDEYGDYQDDDVKNLKNARNDARKMGEVLASQGFVVRCALDVTVQEFELELDVLQDYLGPRERSGRVASDSRVVVYIAGHGFRDPSDSGDYLLMRLETDSSKLSLGADLTTLAGRIEQGRYSIQGLIQRFNSVPSHPVLFFFDACRSLVTIAKKADGTSVRGTVVQLAPQQRVIANRIVAYSTQGGGVAEDTDIAGATQNGLYVAFLSQFINQPGLWLDRILRLTGLMVVSYNDKQQPNFVDRVGLFGDKKWLRRAPSGLCEIMDSAIWENVVCTPLQDKKCIANNICSIVRLEDTGTEDCLTSFKQRWLRQVDVVKVCREASIEHTYNTIGTDLNLGGENSVAASFAGYVRSASATFVVPTTGPIPNAEAIESSIANSTGFKKMKAVNELRSGLLAKSPSGAAPLHTALAPFTIDGQSIELFNLPAASADPIGTLKVDNSKAQIDCQTIVCFDDWVGVRIQSGDQVLRGWSSVSGLSSIVRFDRSVSLTYAAGDTAPDQKQLVELLRSIELSSHLNLKFWRIQLVATRFKDASEVDKFLPVARLVFLRQRLLEAGIRDDLILQTLAEGQGSSNPQVLVNFISPERADAVAKSILK